MKDEKNMFKKLKNDIDSQVNKMEEKISEPKETLEKEFGEFEKTFKKKSEIFGHFSKFHLINLKKEIGDIKVALTKEDIVYLKTDSIAVVLRKLGGLDEFLGTFDKLSKEGYLLVWTEPVSDILPNVLNLPGNFYYFQKVNISPLKE